MMCSHRYPLLAKSIQPPIPYWTQKIILCPRDYCTSAELNNLLFPTVMPWHAGNTASIRLFCEWNVSALLELPSFVANITVARRSPSLEGHIPGIFVAGQASRMHFSVFIWQLYRMCPWKVLYLHWSVTVKTYWDESALIKLRSADVFSITWNSKRSKPSHQHFRFFIFFCSSY
jgi:hypothetical protein